jgi:hypothetical protein
MRRLRFVPAPSTSTETARQYLIAYAVPGVTRNRARRDTRCEARFEGPYRVLTCSSSSGFRIDLLPRAPPVADRRWLGTVAVRWTSFAPTC